jgi:CobQ-like glutamine amidotransferase family enzyme
VTGKPVTILNLYPGHMNVYGDRGNVLTLRRRLEWRGYDVEVIDHHPGDALPDAPDIVFGGGGQDAAQAHVQPDLLRSGGPLRDWAEDGTPMLLVCGLFQLFGHHTYTVGGSTLPGLGVLDVTTDAGGGRLVGNTVTASDEFGALIGFENHGGRTQLGPRARPLGKVPRGQGNNGSDGLEGARYKNVIGTYLHGPVLPKNPKLADHLIQVAVDRRFGPTELVPLADSAVEAARASALARRR